MSNKYILFFLFLPIWIILGILWIIVHLPKRFRIWLGKSLGKFLYLFPSSPKRITYQNLQLCFPEWTDEERKKLAKENFASLGLAVIETMMAWALPDEKLKNLYQLYGKEHALNALQKGKGIIFIAPHFTCIEIIGRLLGMHYQFGVMYKPHKKPYFSYIHKRFRKKHYSTYIPSNRVRELFHALSQNLPIWYAYDVDGGLKRSSVFAPFFGIPASTLTTVSRFARISGASVLPLSYFRRDDNSGYDIIISPSLENFPSDNLYEDAVRLNSVLESAIRQKPSQYIWQYKRFKTRQPGEKRFYT